MIAAWTKIAATRRRLDIIEEAGIKALTQPHIAKVTACANPISLTIP